MKEDLDEIAILKLKNIELREELERLFNTVTNLKEAVRELGHALCLIKPLALGYAPEGQTDTARLTCNRWLKTATDTLEKHAQTIKECGDG